MFDVPGSWAGRGATTLIAIGALVGCGSTPAGLFVDIRSDYVPRTEFDLVRVNLFRGSSSDGAAKGEMLTQADVAADYSDGVRVAEFADIATGTYFVEASLELGGEVQTSQHATVNARGNSILTLPLLHGGALACEGAGDCGEGSECFAWQCEQSACVGIETPTVCRAEQTCDRELGCVDAQDGGSDSDADPPADPASPVQVSAGMLATCAVLHDGRVACWGDNESGVLGDETEITRPTPVLVRDLTEVDNVEVGPNSVCATKTDGSVFCWGANAFSLFGDAEEVPFVSTPFSVPSFGAATQISIGLYYVMCVRLVDGRVRCHGANYDGQLGDGTLVSSTAPVLVAGLSDAAEVRVGYRSVCARTEEGAVKCWGSNLQGALGIGSGILRSSTPAAVSGISDAVDLDVGYTHACALHDGGTASCWGSNSAGQVGDGMTGTIVFTPSPVANVVDASTLSAGAHHTCVLRSNGHVLCWGLNTSGQLGDGTETDRATPVEVAGLEDAVVVDAGATHTCALRETGDILCWGDGQRGQLGDGRGPGPRTPIEVSGLSDATNIAAGAMHTCALGVSGSVSCWGYNGSNQLGEAEEPSSAVPVNLEGLGGATSLAAGSYHSCAVVAGGEVRCWGENSLQKLGGAPTDLDPYVAVTGISGATAVACGASHSCVLHADATVSCWGGNYSGELGQGTIDSSASAAPLAVAGISGATAIFARGNRTCAQSGSSGSLALRCWGGNTHGELGDGTTVTTGAPVLASASGIAEMLSVSLGVTHTCMVNQFGTPFCWGSNSSYQSSAIGTEDQLEAVGRAGLTDAASIAAGGAHTCTVREDATVACWGDNRYGELGDDTYISRATAAPVVGLSDIVRVAAGDSHVCALADNGKVYCWGSSRYGQTGDGTVSGSSIPVITERTW